MFLESLLVNARNTTRPPQRSVERGRIAKRRLLLEGLEERRLLTFVVGASYPAEGAQAIISADFNQDGQPDLATANPASNSVSVLLGNPGGTFQTSASLTAGEWPSAIAVGDFNQDTHLDLVTANTDEFGNGDHLLSLFFGNGTGGFSTAQPGRMHPGGGRRRPCP